MTVCSILQGKYPLGLFGEQTILPFIADELDCPIDSSCKFGLLMIFLFVWQLVVTSRYATQTRIMLCQWNKRNEDCPQRQSLLVNTGPETLDLF